MRDVFSKAFNVEELRSAVDRLAARFRFPRQLFHQARGLRIIGDCKLDGFKPSSFESLIGSMFDKDHISRGSIVSKRSRTFWRRELVEIYTLPDLYARPSWHAGSSHRHDTKGGRL